uniref:Uncharacterized protein n=1 Tax=Rhizophora mucronata TaxID=61149 RepID=A0A2P2NKZ8_RHIMU
MVFKKIRNFSGSIFLEQKKRSSCCLMKTTFWMRRIRNC